MRKDSFWPGAASILLCCFAQAAHAVKPGAVSTTAEYVCYFRAIAAQRPDPKLRNPDGLADKLCPPNGQLPRPYEAARKFIDYSGETYAGYFYVNARTMYIDAALERAVEAGATQVVVLGAGFDSRAYRFHASHPRVRFFEVDLPAMVEEKKNRLIMVFGVVPDYVQYAPIDFDHERLEDVLPRLGYDSGRRTFFILEGVTMYQGRRDLRFARGSRGGAGVACGGARMRGGRPRGRR